MTSDNVIQRINKAREIIAETDFQKSGQVTGGQKYNFIPIGQILQAVRKAHAIAGVTVTFDSPEYDTEQFEKRYSYQKKSQYGETTWFAAVGHIHATIYGSSVDDRIEMDIPFEAQDNSDKLTNKIITNAERCLYRVLYAIDEGDATDPEAFNEPMQDAPKESRKRVTADDDPFFSKGAPSIESEFVTGDVAKKKLDAETRRKMQQATEGRNKLAVFDKDNPDCTILQEAKDTYGDNILNWADGAVLHVMEALEEVGLL